MGFRTSLTEVSTAWLTAHPPRGHWRSANPSACHRYRFQLTKFVALTADYQLFVNRAYNETRTGVGVHRRAALSTLARFATRMDRTEQIFRHAALVLGPEPRGGTMPAIEANRAKVVAQLLREGWELVRHGSEHDIYRRPGKTGTAAVPRHRRLSPGVARTIAKAAGWL